MGNVAKTYSESKRGTRRDARFAERDSNGGKNVKRLLVIVCLATLPSVLIAATPNVRAPEQTLSEKIATWSPPPPAYLCAYCTQAQLDIAMRMLGPGRHLFVDLATAAPQAYVVKQTSTGDVAIERDAPTDAEQQRFDLMRRLWMEKSASRFTEAELAGLLRPRRGLRSASLISVTSALQNDFSDALDALVPTMLPLPCRALGCTGLKKTPDAGEIEITLDDGGVVSMVWSRNGSAVVREIRGASGAKVPLMANNELTGETR